MKYSTSQKALLIDFLMKNKDKAMSAEEIYKGIDGRIGKSTVYRLLAELSGEGGINRFAKENGRGVLYQYAHEKKCTGHLHMKCLKCDKIYHMDEKRSESILKTIREDSDFSVSDSSTVLFGVCSDCNKQNA
ncbi:MAG: transcriptional repressor [Clostridia bacterium]|nr:transcriptional repressor [Clostridia bacterium]